MPDRWANLAANPKGIGLAVLVILIAAALILRLALKKKPSPEELERRRRLKLHHEGKMGDGEIVDVGAGSIVYSYSVAGMEYTASQDTGDLQSALPPNSMNLIGPIRIKFDPRNPANSIVLCEEWSGLTQTPAPRA
ncbi:MAG TPA: hypothetical protein VHZ74_12710 [Bryobacteraceae bacterium]|jgi:hypothetical protein|nr:hypothetical protein [Bryobacteraceae bacterium]